ncbi:MAG: hypothetical protein V8Q82_06630 [Christensenellales bacterium]
MGGLQKLGNTRKRGTLVRFLPDDTVFEDHRFNTTSSPAACGSWPT